MSPQNILESTRLYRNSHRKLVDPTHQREVVDTAAREVGLEQHGDLAEDVLDPATHVDPAGPHQPVHLPELLRPHLEVGFGRIASEIEAPIILLDLV